MSARVSVRLVATQADQPEGNSADQDHTAAIAVKTATTPGDMERLAGEAERLQRASHPGLVTFVAHQAGDGRTELHTLYAGDSLATWSGTVTQIAGLAAAVATTLADLHDLGWVHGRIDPSHVLVGPDGRPQLCGMSPIDGAEPADDVAAVGHLVDELVGRIRARPPNGGAFGWLARLRGPLAEQRALGQVVLHATDPNPARRPTARALARSLLGAVSGAQLPDARLADLEPSAASTDVEPQFTRAFVDQTEVGVEDVFRDRPWIEVEPEHGHHNYRNGGRTGVAGSHRLDRQRAAGTRLVVVAGLASVLGGAAWFLAPATIGAGQPDNDDTNDNSEPSDVGVTPHDEEVAELVEVAGASEDVPAGCPPTPEDVTASSTQHVVDIDGDGCPERVSIDDGVIEAAGERWAIGEPGDDIALGDWNCDGRVTPGAYRRSTGDVFLFADWADHDQPLTATPVGRVDGGVALEAVAISGEGVPGDACDAPAVHLPDGQQRILEVTP